MRLFPINYRALPPGKRFTKYQWIEAELKRAQSDARPESHHISVDTIRLLDVVPTDRAWAARKAILKPLMRPSLCEIQSERDDRGYPTLGLFKPKAISKLAIKPCATDWTPAQKAILSQEAFAFDHHAPKNKLEKIPFDFLYHFTCSDPECRGHKLSCTDWEMAEAYRDWRSKYGEKGWERAFRQKFETEMIDRCDTHFYVGTVHKRPQIWIIVGLFYPPKQKMGDLFD